MPTPKKSDPQPKKESTKSLTPGQQIIQRQREHTGPQSEADKVISGIGAREEAK